MSEISIIVPALNEEGNLTPLVEDLNKLSQNNKLDIEIIIVDDSSDDGTLEEARRLERSYPHVKAVSKGLPRGFGSAVRKGIETAAGRAGFIISADNVDPIETIPRMAQKILHEGHTLMLLSRRLRKGDDDYIPVKYRFFQWGFRWLTIFLLGLPFKDTTYSYRGFDLDVMKRLNIESPGFEISPEITFKTWLNGYKIGEVAAKPRVRKKGGSKFSFTRAGKGYPKVLLRAFCYRFTKRW